MNSFVVVAIENLPIFDGIIIPAKTDAFFSVKFLRFGHWGQPWTIAKRPTSRYLIKFLIENNYFHVILYILKNALNSIRLVSNYIF